MKRLTMPRARRPVNARVSAVGALVPSRSRCAGFVPASGASMKAVPACAAAAPAARAAATACASMRPPVAISGSLVTAAARRSSVRSPTGSAGSSKPPRWPPASAPWTTRAVAPAASAPRTPRGGAPRRFGHPRLCGICDGHPDLDARPPEVRYVADLRAAEGERRDSGALIEQQPHLVAPAVVVVPGLARLLERGDVRGELVS